MRHCLWRLLIPGIGRFMVQLIILAMTGRGRSEIPGPVLHVLAGALVLRLSETTYGPVTRANTHQHRGQWPVFA